MSQSFGLTPAAEQDLNEAADWYNDQQDGLAERFLEAARAAFTWVCDAPSRSAMLYRGARRLPIRGFPYAALYVLENEMVVIVAVLHNRRDPSVWMRRVDDQQES
ncbi:MAG TPA: type II toxin-antitoxin system RelE/ParE family toxin [Planctomycetaceae bacterium]|nr:type II toxin-antitoxin system RelE/ParE family toxin [Planctomycetaceae bacterium]